MESAHLPNGHASESVPLNSGENELIQAEAVEEKPKFSLSVKNLVIKKVCLFECYAHDKVFYLERINWRLWNDWKRENCTFERYSGTCTFNVYSNILLVFVVLFVKKKSIENNFKHYFQFL